MNHDLKIFSKTCINCTNSIFDFEAEFYFKSKLSVKTNGILTRNNRKIKFVKEKFKSNKYINYLGTIDIYEEQFIYSFENIQSKENYKFFQNYEDKCYISLRDTYFEDKGYLLKLNDTIKLGKINFVVKEMHINQNYTNVKTTQIIQANQRESRSLYASEITNIKPDLVTNNSQNDLLSKQLLIKENSKKAKNKPICRICFGEENSIDQPLMSPCKCSGSMKYVHLTCLKSWLNLKIQIKTLPSVMMCYYEDIQCELCKSPFPKRVKIKDKQYNLIDLPIPTCTYMILESSSSSTKGKNFVYIIHFNDPFTEIKFGRCKEADVRVSDVSVSRNHATVIFKNNSFYFVDNKSKFGTLILLRKCIYLNPNKSIFLQVGRSLIQYTVSMTLLACLLCFKSKQTFIQKDYNVGLVNEPKDASEKVYECGYDSNKDNEGEEELIIDTLKDKLLLITDNDNMKKKETNEERKKSKFFALQEKTYTQDKTLSNLNQDNFQSNAFMILGNNNMEKNYNDSMECLKENHEDASVKFNYNYCANMRKSKVKELYSTVNTNKQSLATKKKRNSFKDKIPQMLEFTKMNNFFN